MIMNNIIYVSPILYCLVGNKILKEIYYINPIITVMFLAFLGILIHNPLNRAYINTNYEYRNFREECIKKLKPKFTRKLFAYKFDRDLLQNYFENRKYNKKIFKKAMIPIFLIFAIIVISDIDPLSYINIGFILLAGVCYLYFLFMCYFEASVYKKYGKNEKQIVRFLLLRQLKQFAIVMSFIYIIKHMEYN